MQLQANDVLGRRFRLERLLGEGGMGMVWSAWDLAHERRTALKFLRSGTATEAARRRFFREARASMAVQHPNVVRVHELLTAPDGSPLMVMDFLDGESLGERLEKRHKLSLREVADLLLPVLSAVGSAHAMGIVHRDLKPDNIFLCKTATGDDARVLDFGIAKLTARDGEAMATAGLTSTGAVLGTPYYMSPEQVFADKTIDQRADVWSLGVILYECLAGARPLGGDSIGALLRAITNGDIVSLRDREPALPSEVHDLCDRMISVERDRRPRDLREVCDVLARHSSKAIIPFGEATMDASLALDETLPAEPMSLVSTNDGVVSTALPAPKRGPLAAIAAALVAASLGGAWFLRASFQPRQPAPIVTPASEPTVAASVTPPPPPLPELIASAPRVASASPSSVRAAPSARSKPASSPSAVGAASTPLAAIPSASAHAPGVASINPY